MSENTKNQSKNQEHNKEASKVDDMKKKNEQHAAHDKKHQVKKEDVVGKHKAK